MDITVIEQVIYNYGDIMYDKCTSWFTAGASSTQPCDHVQLTVYISGATNRFHLNCRHRNRNSKHEDSV